MKGRHDVICQEKFEKLENDMTQNMKDIIKKQTGEII